MTYRTRIAIEVESDRPLPKDRLAGWVRRGASQFGVSLHETEAEPGDRAAGEDDWEYLRVGLVAVQDSRVVNP